MPNILKGAAIICGVAGALAFEAAAPSFAQVVVVEPFAGGPYRYRYESPYDGFAYAPGYQFRRSWDYPAGTDNTGSTFTYGDLGWQGGPPSGAPANPCWPSQRTFNRC